MTDATPTPAPRKIGIVGFAGSRGEAPFNDPSWELWAINDVFASGHVPRANVTFELHQTDQLSKQGRRGVGYIDWLKKGVQPVFMVDPRPEFPTAQRFPFEAVRSLFPRDYWTNSVAWVMALAVAELTEVVKLPDGRAVRVGKPGCQLGLWGIHMAAESEFQDQRRCCEYIIGIADACQLPVYVPASSELMKAASLYGLDTTEPLRVSLDAKIAECVQAGQQIDQQLAAMQQQLQALAQQRASVTGQKEAYKALRNNWTMPTDRVPTEAERAERHAIAASDHQPTESVAVPVEVTVTGG